MICTFGKAASIILPADSVSILHSMAFVYNLAAFQRLSFLSMYHDMSYVGF